MIPRTEPSWQAESASNWQQQLKEAISDPKILLNRLNLDNSLLPAAQMASRQFPLRVPYSFVERMEIGNPLDPLLQQVLPIQAELIAHSGYSTDPLREQENQQPGLIQKYQGRVLLLVNGHCAINCRYCFRRHFPYEQNRLSRQQWLPVIEQLAKDTSIEEVIYSGGDPLASSDKQLQWLTTQLVAIPHIKRLRIHSRLPVVIPDRVTEQCIDWLSNHRLQTVFVFHINHPKEINGALQEAINKLKLAGITVLNQSVLLKGVNDKVSTLKHLSNKLFEVGVLPYYLHLFDPVAGASHFDIPLSKAESLHRDLMACLPGYLVPKLVKEVAGEASKTPASLLHTLFSQ